MSSLTALVNLVHKVVNRTRLGRTQEPKIPRLDA